MREAESELQSLRLCISGAGPLRCGWGGSAPAYAHVATPAPERSVEADKDAEAGLLTATRLLQGFEVPGVPREEGETPKGFGGQQQTVDALRARVREAEARLEEEARRHAEAEAQWTKERQKFEVEVTQVRSRRRLLLLSSLSR